MRFAKVFLLLAVFTFCIHAVSGAADAARKQAAVYAYGSKAALQEAYKKLKEQEATEPTALYQDYVTKVVPIQNRITYGEYAANFVLILLAAMFYLRMNRAVRMSTEQSTHNG